MKKLLYTFLIGLLVISCDKNELGGDYAPNALSSDTEIALDKQSISDALERLSNKKFEKSESKLTARSTNDEILLVTGVYEGAWYEFAFSEENTACNTDLGITVVYLTLNSSNGVDVALTSGGSAAITVDGNFAFLFDLNIVSGTQLTEAGVITEGTVNGLSITF